MPVDNPDVVDAVGIDKASGQVVLTIADALDWGRVDEHLLFLQKKINRYLDFIDSGEISEHRADADARGIRIDVVFRFPPPDAAIGFLSRADDLVKEHGEGFTWRIYSA